MFTGSATVEPDDVLKMSHCVPNIFWALPTLTVALTRRWVTSTVAVIPLDLNALTTPLRFDEEAPYLLWSVDSVGYLPYEDERRIAGGLDPVLQVRLARRSGRAAARA